MKLPTSANRQVRCLYSSMSGKRNLITDIKKRILRDLFFVLSVVGENNTIV